MTQAPELTTERLVLDRFSPDDVPFVRELHANPDLVRFIPSSAMTSDADALAWVDRVTSQSGPVRGWWRVSTRDGTPVGAVVLKPIRYSVGQDGDEVEIGWRWHAGHTGRGYATEAARVLLAAGFASGLARVIAVTDPHNHASQAVCRRIGMTPVGLSDRYYDETVEVFEALA